MSPGKAGIGFLAVAFCGLPVGTNQGQDLLEARLAGGDVFE